MKNKFSLDLLFNKGLSQLLENSKTLSASDKHLATNVAASTSHLEIETKAENSKDQSAILQSNHTYEFQLELEINEAQGPTPQEGFALHLSIDKPKDA